VEVGLAEYDLEHFRKLGPRGNAQKEWRDSVRLQAISLVNGHVEAIDDVAKALLRSGRLSGAQVRRIVERYG